MYCKSLESIVDKRRREVINKYLEETHGEVSHMYYEGMRVAYQELQGMISIYAELEEKGK